MPFIDNCATRGEQVKIADFLLRNALDKLSYCQNGRQRCSKFLVYSVKFSFASPDKISIYSNPSLNECRICIKCNNMKLLKRILKGVGILVLVLFAGLFIYANKAKPSLGERVYMENPTQIVVMQFPDSFSGKDSTEMEAYFMQQKGVYSNVISLKSQTLCVTIDPRKTSRSAILDLAKGYHPGLVERQPLQSRAECPVNMYAFRKLTYALNIRK